MARELKFKAWSKRDSAWYMDGSAFDLNYSGGYGDFYFDNDHPADMRGADLVWCQFTGLKDSEGRKIYERDIIEISGGYEGAKVGPTKARVFFKDGAFQTDFHDALLRIALPGNWLVRVIGNELEHPELLGTTTA